MASVAKREWAHNGEARTAWVVRYKEGGKHRSKQFELKKDADAFRRKVERELEDGVHIPESEKATVQEVAELFLKYQEERARDGRIGTGTLTLFKTAIDHDIVPQLGYRAIGDLAAKDVMDFYNHMRNRLQVIPSGLITKRSINIRPRRGLAPRTARARISILKQMLDWSQFRGYIKRDIMPEAAKQLRGIKRTRIRTFDIEQMRTLLAAMEDRSVRGRKRAHLLIRCFVTLAAFCGLRIGEIKALTIGHVLLDRRLIEVRHNLTAKDGLKGPKTVAGNRNVPMPGVVVELLREWLARYYVPNERNLIFRLEDGGMLTSGTFHTSYWLPLLKRAGLSNDAGDHLHFHALRHFSSSWLIHNGMSIMDVASRMGHESFDMTLGTYAHTIAGGSHRFDEADEMASQLKLPSPSVTQGLRKDD